MFVALLERSKIIAVAIAVLLAGSAPTFGQSAEPLPQDPNNPGFAAQPVPSTEAAPATPADPNSYSRNELVETGTRFFGDVSQGLAGVVEHAIARYGLPNGYIVGSEASGAIAAGARYGEGTLYTKNAGQHQVYWQGPSLGFDVGANGDRVMMLIYNLPSVDAMYRRYVGINGSAYVVAGMGMTVLSRGGVFVVPIVSGVGARLGVNVGYLKFTQRRTWNPF